MESMDVEIKIIKNLEKPYAVIYTSQIDEETQKIVSMLESANDIITAVHNDRTMILKGDDIYLIRIENEKQSCMGKRKAM